MSGFAIKNPYFILMLCMIIAVVGVVPQWRACRLICSRR